MAHCLVTEGKSLKIKMALISIYIRVKALFITNTGGGDGNGDEGGYPIGGGGDGNSGVNPNPLLGSEDPICNGCTPTVPVLPALDEDVALRYKINNILELQSGSAEHDWLYNQATHEQLQNIDDFFEENGKSGENKSFINSLIGFYLENLGEEGTDDFWDAAIDAFEDGGEVDFDYEIFSMLDGTDTGCIHDKMSEIDEDDPNITLYNKLLNHFNDATDNWLFFEVGTTGRFSI